MASIDTYFKSGFLKVDDLDGKPHKLTIKEIGEFSPDEGNPKPTLKFEETEKEFGLNKTNCNILADLIGSRDMDDWVGHRIKLYPTKTEFQGKRVPCIRINDEFHELPSTNGKPATKSKKLTSDEGDDEIPF